MDFTEMSFNKELVAAEDDLIPMDMIIFPDKSQNDEDCAVKRKSSGADGEASSIHNTNNNSLNFSNIFNQMNESNPN